jgi:hypothetical protein
MKTAIVSIILGIVFGCAQQTKTREVKMNEEFTLGINGQVFIKTENLTVEFVSVLEDSRCPVGVDCLWEGNAKIRIKVSKADEESTAFELNTHLEPTNISFRNYKIYLVRIEPEPKADISAKTENYSATLLLRANSPRG